MSGFCVCGKFSAVAHESLCLHTFKPAASRLVPNEKSMVSNILFLHVLNELDLKILNVSQQTKQCWNYFLSIFDAVLKLLTLEQSFKIIALHKIIT